jgi:hypothetical protein
MSLKLKENVPVEFPLYHLNYETKYASHGFCDWIFVGMRVQKEATNTSVTL